MKKLFFALVVALPVLAIAQPTITSVTPRSGNAGSSVTIVGTNFSTVADNNTVHFGSVDGTVTSATATKLIVTVPTGASSDYITVNVNALIAYSPIPFIPTFVGNGVIDQTSFTIVKKINTDYNPTFIFLEDLDKDGLPDITAPAYDADDYPNFIEIFANTTLNNTIDFANNTSQRVGAYNSVLVDVDGDGLKDIVGDSTDNHDDDDLVIYTNPGTISNFGTVHHATANSFYNYEIVSTCFAAGDLDLDGQTDLVLADYFDYGGITTLPNSKGQYPSALQKYYYIDDDPTWVTMADLDGNKLPDVMVTRTYQGQVRVYPNISTKGDVELSTYYLAFTPDTSPSMVTTGDIDGDGKVDMITVNQASISIFWNMSTTANGINFNDPVNIPFPAIPLFAAVGDLNADGMVDIAVTTQMDSSVTILKNLSAVSGPISPSSFAPGVRYTVYPQPTSVAIGDLNDDGAADMAVVCSDSKKIVLLQNTKATPVVTELQVYNGVSPDANGENDSWIIKNINLIADTKTNHVSIVNRWGDNIYEADNYDNTNVVFTGRNKSGGELPDGVYFYKVTFASGHKALTGYLSLKK